MPKLTDWLAQHPEIAYTKGEVCIDITFFKDGSQFPLYMELADTNFSDYKLQLTCASMLFVPHRFYHA